VLLESLCAHRRAPPRRDAVDKRNDVIDPKLAQDRRPPPVVGDSQRKQQMLAACTEHAALGSDVERALQDRIGPRRARNRAVH
jgi:hypothetical protein